MSNALKQHLKSTGKTQGQFATEVGVREATVSAWVNGAAPRAAMIQRIAEVTGGAVPVTSWFSDPSEMVAAASLAPARPESAA